MVDCHKAKTTALTFTTENISVNSSQTFAQCCCNMVKKLFQNEDVAINVPLPLPSPIWRQLTDASNNLV